MARVKRDDITHFTDEDIYLPTRTLYLGTASVSDDDKDAGVDYLMAERAIKGLHILDTTSTETGITVILNTIGGDINHSMAIYDAIKGCKSHVTVKVMGQAMSMGSIILQAADERLMTPNSVLMLHYGNTDISDHDKNVERYVEWNKGFNEWMESLFLDRIKVVKPKTTKADLKKAISFDKYMSAKEALALNLIDGIIEYDGSITRRS